MTHAQSTLENFLNELASRAPTPGGGSASALGGAIGVALASMAAAFTTGNEKYKAVEPQVLALMQEFETFRRGFLELLEADVAAYAAYAAARGLPRATPDEKQRRAAAMAAANEQATAAPERIVAAARRGLELVEQLGAVVNPNLAGDVAVAAYFLEAAARGAGIQVLSNCAAADTDGANARRRAAVHSGLGQCQQARERIDRAVLKMLKLEA